MCRCAAESADANTTTPGCTACTASHPSPPWTQGKPLLPRTHQAAGRWVHVPAAVELTIATAASACHQRGSMRGTRKTEGIIRGEADTS